MLPYESALRAGLVPRLKELVKSAISASALPLGTVIRVATREPAIALTFDDGPHPEDTPPLLDLLERHGARATFFVVGKSARRWPELIERIAAGGHALGNHTWDHLSMPVLRGRYRRKQIEWCAEAICWDVIAEDWRNDSSEAMLARVYRRLRRGSIVLFHDTLYTTVEEDYRDRAPMRAAVEKLLTDLSGEYRFVTVPELLKLGRPVRWHWYQRSRLDWLQRVR
jgi:peptidoglycan/xylan/chitin deacetylase (PgdA/CDA1 family)